MGVLGPLFPPKPTSAASSSSSIVSSSLSSASAKHSGSPQTAGGLLWVNVGGDLPSSRILPSPSSSLFERSMGALVTNLRGAIGGDLLRIDPHTPESPAGSRRSLLFGSNVVHPSPSPLSLTSVLTDQKIFAAAAASSPQETQSQLQPISHLHSHSQLQSPQSQQQQQKELLHPNDFVSSHSNNANVATTSSAYTNHSGSPSEQSTSSKNENSIAHVEQDTELYPIQKEKAGDNNSLPAPDTHHQASSSSLVVPKNSNLAGISPSSAATNLFNFESSLGVGGSGVFSSQFLSPSGFSPSVTSALDEKSVSFMQSSKFSNLWPLEDKDHTVEYIMGSFIDALKATSSASFTSPSLSTASIPTETLTHASNSTLPSSVAMTSSESNLIKPNGQVAPGRIKYNDNMLMLGMEDPTALIPGMLFTGQRLDGFAQQAIPTADIKDIFATKSNTQNYVDYQSTHNQSQQMSLFQQNSYSSQFSLSGIHGNAQTKMMSSSNHLVNVQDSVNPSAIESHVMMTGYNSFVTGHHELDSATSPATLSNACNSTQIDITNSSTSSSSNNSNSTPSPNKPLVPSPLSQSSAISLHSLTQQQHQQQQQQHLSYQYEYSYQQQQSHHSPLENIPTSAHNTSSTKGPLASSTMLLNHQTSSSSILQSADGVLGNSYISYGDGAMKSSNSSVSDSKLTAIGSRPGPGSSSSSLSSTSSSSSLYTPTLVPKPCPISGCKRSFVKPRSLQKHLIGIHGVQESSSSSYAGDGTNDGGDVEGEEDVTGSGKAKPFKCKLCAQTFSRSHDLKRHYYIHSTQKPYPCPRCNKGFARRDALRRHQKAVDDGKKVHCVPTETYKNELLRKSHDAGIATTDAASSSSTSGWSDNKMGFTSDEFSAYSRPSQSSYPSGEDDYSDYDEMDQEFA